MLVSQGNRNLQAAATDWQTWQQTTWEPTSWTDVDRMPLPDFAANLETPGEWTHWQEQNWHSFLEQAYGFINGLGIALALSILVTRLPLREPLPVDRRTLLLSLVLLVPGLAYVNLIKNVAAWTTDQVGAAAVPTVMQAPWIDLSLSTMYWFRLFFVVGTIAYLAIVLWHFRRPVALLSGTWLARSQLLYLLLLWIFVLGNLMRTARISRGKTADRGRDSVPCDPGQFPGFDRPAPRGSDLDQGVACLGPWPDSGCRPGRALSDRSPRRGNVVDSAYLW